MALVNIVRSNSILLHPSLAILKGRRRRVGGGGYGPNFSLYPHLLRLEEQDGAVAEVKVYEMLRLYTRGS